MGAYRVDVLYRHVYAHASVRSQSGFASYFRQPALKVYMTVRLCTDGEATVVKIEIKPEKLGEGTFVDYKILAGFTDTPHFQQLASSTLSVLDEGSVSDIMGNIETAQAARQDLEPVDTSEAVLGPIPKDHTDYLNKVRESDPFMQIYGEREHEFALVDAGRLCIFQPNVSLEYSLEVPGESMKDMLEYCIPESFEVQAEVSVSNNRPEMIIVTESSNLSIEQYGLDGDKVCFSFGPNKNWVQVAELGNRFYLKNGYHRVHSLLEKGVRKIPAIIYPATDWDDTGGNKPGFFSHNYLKNLDRPPIMDDFFREELVIEIPRRKTKKAIIISASEHKIPI